MRAADSANAALATVHLGSCDFAKPLLRICDVECSRQRLPVQNGNDSPTSLSASPTHQKRQRSRGWQVCGTNPMGRRAKWCINYALGNVGDPAGRQKRAELLNAQSMPQWARCIQRFQARLKVEKGWEFFFETDAFIDQLIPGAVTDEKFAEDLQIRPIPSPRSLSWITSLSHHRARPMCSVISALLVRVLACLRVCNRALTG